MTENVAQEVQRNLPCLLPAADGVENASLLTTITVFNGDGKILRCLILFVCQLQQ